MTPSITLGTVTSQPGTIQYGQWDAFDHPTGITESLPVIIAQGREDGPCIWLTAGIHGTEHTGPVVLYRLLTQELVDQLRGTIVAIPVLSPVGIRTQKYTPYHVDKNPNRLWPDGKPKSTPDPEKHPGFSLELAYQRLFDAIVETADYLIDYHNAWIDSVSFAFQDRILYRADDNPDRNKEAAAALGERQMEMLRAYGHTIVTEYPAEKYIKDDLHRSTSGSVLLLAHIPAFTVELGTGLMPDPAIVAASVAGTRNVLRWAGMHDGPMEAIEGIQVIDPGYRVRRSSRTRTPAAGIVLHRVEAGDLVATGDVIAEVVDVWGRPIGDGVIRAECDGFALGWRHGIYHYPGDTVIYLAIRDDLPVIGPYPEKYFEVKDPSEPESAR